MLTVYLIFCREARSVLGNQAGCDTAEGDQNDRGKDKYSTVHKEILGKYADDLILIPAEVPVVLAGEEDHVKGGKGLVKIYGNQTADKGKSTQQICTRGECNIHSEWFPQLEHTHLLQYKQQSRTAKRDKKYGGIKVK